MADDSKASTDDKSLSSNDTSSNVATKAKGSSSSSLLTIGSVVVVLIGIGLGLYTQFDDVKDMYHQYFPADVRVFSKSELARHDSSRTKQAWLAILGDVFDVSRGASYKKGGSYDFFTGKDASAAFVSGDFTDAGLHDDVSQIETSSLLGIKDWNEFYHKDYKFIGRLNGRFYDENGKPTDDMREFERRLKVAESLKAEQKRLKQKYPSCNHSSGTDTGTEVWCTDKAGGVKRDWAGVPRMFTAPGQEKTRCACVKEADAVKMKDQMKVYPGCVPSSSRCVIRKAPTK